jgi:integrase
VRTYARFERSVPYRSRKNDRERRYLLVSFLWKGPTDDKPRRYRESTGLEDSRASRRAWKRRLDEINEELQKTHGGLIGTFDPTRYFPHFAHRGIEPSPPQHARRATVSDLLRDYIDSLPGTEVSEYTRRQYESVFRTHVFGNALAKVHLDELTDNHIKRWLGEVRQTKVRGGKAIEASTVNKILARVRTAVTLAWKRGDIPRSVNPMDLVENLRQESAEPNPFTPDELLALFAVTEGQQRALYITFALSGLRPGEMFGLSWEDVDTRNMELRIRRQVLENGEVSERLKTLKSRRNVTIFEPVRTAISALQAKNRLRTRFVFANRDGSPLNVRWQDDDPWRRALERAGLEYRRLYLLRHTYTFLMLSAGKPLQWIAAQLGHRGVAKIDETYGRWRDAHKLPARPLDLEEFFKAIRNLPPFAAKTRPNLPRICQEFFADTADG